MIEYFYARFLDQIELDSWNLQDIRVDTRMKLEVMADLSRLDISLSELTSTFQVPKEWILLQRTLVLLMGVATHLHPEMRPLAIVRPYLEEFVLGRDRDWMGLATKAVKDMALSVLDDSRRLQAPAGPGPARRSAPRDPWTARGSQPDLRPGPPVDLHGVHPGDGQLGLLRVHPRRREPRPDPGLRLRCLPALVDGLDLAGPQVEERASQEMRDRGGDLEHDVVPPESKVP